MFPLFQSVGASLDCHGYSDMMSSGMATSSAISLWTLRCILSGPMDLFSFKFETI